MLKLQNTMYNLGVHGEVGTSRRLWRLQPCCLWKNSNEGSEEIAVGRGSIQRLYRGRSGTGRGHGQVWVCFWYSLCPPQSQGQSSRRNLLVLWLQLYKAIVDFAEHPPRQFCHVSSLFKTCLHKIFEHGCISAWLSVSAVVGHVPGHLALNFFQ